MRQAVLGLVAAGALVACMPNDDSASSGETATPPAEGPCRAASGVSLIGQRYTEALGAEAMRLTGARAVRAYKTGDPVTMDYRPDRVNVEYDEGWIVRAVSCG